MDRDYAPKAGDSSRQAANRLRSFLEDQVVERWAAIAVVTHGGITADLLRTLLGDEAVPATLVNEGVPACAVTTLDDLNVIDLADVAHLTGP